MAARADMALERALGWFEASERGARLLGAPLAGVLVAAIGPLTVLVVDAGTFVLSALLVAVLVPAPERHHRPSAGTGPARSGYWSELADGVRFLVGEPLLRAIVLLVFVTNVFDATKSTVLLPVAAERELGGAVALGVLFGTMGGGALVGSLVFGSVGHRLPRRPLFVAAFAVAGGPPFLALAAGFPLQALVAVTAVAGLAAGALNPLIGTVKLERVPVGMRARVYGVIAAGAWAGMPLGSLGAGYAVEQVGLDVTLVAVGTAYVAVSLVPLAGGAWRGLDRVAPPR